MTPEIPVLITAVGGIGNGEQILKALNLAPTGRYQLIAADIRKDVPQFGLAQEAVTLPPASSKEYLDALQAVCRHFGVRAVFHGSVAEMLVFSRNLEMIRSWGVLPMINDPALINLCAHKHKLGSRLTDLGFEPPASIEISRDSTTSMDGLQFPLIIKPTLESGGSRGIHIARNARELELIRDLTGVAEHIVVQEYVGRPDREFTVGVLHDFNGAYIATSVLRRDLSNLLGVSFKVKNTSGRDELGPDLVVSSGISAGEFGDWPEIAKACRKMAEALGSRGPLNFQCRVDDKGVRVFEINPRFSGTTSLRAMADVNEPDLMLRLHILGESIPRGLTPRPIRIVRSLLENEVADLAVPSWSELDTHTS